MAEKEYPGLTLFHRQLDNSHISVYNPENDSKTGKTDPLQLNIEKKPY